MSTTLSDASLSAVRAYVAVRPSLDTRSKIKLAEQAEALLREGWEAETVASFAAAFAELAGSVEHFALWASRRKRERLRAWWTD